MGKRKLLIVVLFHLLFFVNEVSYAEVVSGIILDKDGIVIQFTEMDYFDLVEMTGIEIFNDDYLHNIYISPDLIEMVNENTILVKLTEKRFMPNNYYHIIITLKNSYIHLFTFWGNISIKLREYYLFPLIEVPNIRILVFRQKIY